MTEQDHTTNPPLKCCSKCKRELPATTYYFHRSRIRSDGFEYWCKECRGNKFGEHPDVVRASHKGQKRCSKGDDCVHPDGCWQPATNEYFSVHKHKHDGMRTYCKACEREARSRQYWKDPEKSRARDRRYRADNPEHFREKDRQYRVMHPERLQEQRRRHKARIRETTRVNQQIRRAHRRAISATFTRLQWQNCLNYWHGCCAYCSRQRDFWHTLEQDHYIPLTLNGEYTATNIVPACKSCNTSKGNTPPSDWLVSKFGARKAAGILARIEAYFAWAKENEGR